MDIKKIDKTDLQLAINTIKMLSVDMVEKAESGHPGLPMGFADTVFVLWMNFLKFNPLDTTWTNRDRFILSAGHGSALLYSLLHLFGYPLSLDELKTFRQFGSQTPGHPEYGHTKGVETTTGPLGQGFANAVGMAIAERHKSEQLKVQGIDILDHYTYCVVSDGDLMEGISSEAASVAGHLGLSKLICLYDDNNITIEGKTDLAFSEDVGKRFEAFGWHVEKADGYNHSEIASKILSAQAEKNKPSIIIVKTHIGMGSPNKQDSASAHGEPLGANEIRLTKENIGWSVDKPFYIPEKAKAVFERRAEDLKSEYNNWMERFNKIKGDPLKFAAWNKVMTKDIPENLGEKILKDFANKKEATRSAGGEILQKISALVPSIIGGSADLAPSTKTYMKVSGALAKNSYENRNIHFGIREHAMGGILNGIALYGGTIPYGSTFLVFSDYMRCSIRLSAIMKQQVIYIFTHDSIFVGEDGPTHQPIEHVSSLRLIPNLLVLRPADSIETAYAWLEAIKNTTGPTALILTRQNLPPLDRTDIKSAPNLSHGAYAVTNCDGTPDIIILASGSEVHLAVNAAVILRAKGYSKIRVISVPSFELFDKQSEEYQKTILPDTCKKVVAVEAGRSNMWYKYTGRDGLVIGIDTFGASAPANVMAERFGFTAGDVADKICQKWRM